MFDSGEDTGQSLSTEIKSDNPRGNSPWIYMRIWSFPAGSDGKASVCNVGDPSSIPGSGRSPGGWNGTPLQYSFLPGESHGQRSLVGYSLWGCKESDTTEQLYLLTYTREGIGTPLQHSCLGNPRDGGAWWATVHGVAKSQTRLSDFTFIFHFHALEKEMAAHSSVLAWRIPEMGAWWAAVYGVAQSRTRLKRLSSGIHGKDWCWSWSSNPLAIWYEEPTHWKGLWCWERLWAGGEEGNREWDGWVLSLTQWTWVWANSRK